jgi:hypothetical protein
MCVYVYFYSVHVSGSHVSIIRRICFATCTPNGHLYRVTYTRCRIDTINSLDDGHVAARTHVENRNKTYMKKRIVLQVGYLQRLYRDARSTEHKITGHNFILL